MPIRPVAVVLFALLPCLAVAQEIPWQTERVMLRADGVRAGRPVAGHLVRQGKELSANKVYTVLRADGGLLELGDNLGWVTRAEVVRMAEAKAYFSQRIKEEPKVAKWHGRRAATYGTFWVDITATGQLRRNTDHPLGVLDDLQEAVRLAPADKTWRQELAKEYLALGRFEKAAELHEKDLELAPDDAGSYIGRAMVRLAQGDPTRAVADVERAAKLAPESFSEQNSLALVYAHTGQTAKMAVQYRRVAAMPVSTSADYNQRAIARANTGDIEGMRADLNEAVRLDPTAIRAIRTRGCLLRRRGEYHAALTDFRRAARLLRDDPAAMRMEAFLLATCKEDALRDGQRAVELAENAVKSGGDDGEWANLETLAAAYAEVGKFPEAIATQKRAIKALEGQPDFYDEISGLNWWLKQYEAEKPRRE